MDSPRALRWSTSTTLDGANSRSTEVALGPLRTFANRSLAEIIMYDTEVRPRRIHCQRLGHRSFLQIGLVRRYRADPSAAGVDPSKGRLMSDDMGAQTPRELELSAELWIGSRLRTWTRKPDGVRPRGLDAPLKEAANSVSRPPVGASGPWDGGEHRRRTADRNGTPRPGLSPEEIAPRTVPAPGLRSIKPGE
jgi:hypothetical protein